MAAVILNTLKNMRVQTMASGSVFLRSDWWSSLVFSVMSHCWERMRKKVLKSNLFYSELSRGLSLQWPIAEKNHLDYRSKRKKLIQRPSFGLVFFKACKSTAVMRNVLIVVLFYFFPALYQLPKISHRHRKYQFVTGFRMRYHSSESECPGCRLSLITYIGLSLRFT